MSTFTIGQVAERTGFPASTLRYYEDLGLVVPAGRTDAGYRLYDDDAVERLAFVARAKQLGCSLEEITDLLAVWDGKQCGPVQHRFHELVTEKIRGTHAQIAQLLAFGAQLQEAARRLDTASVDGPCSADCACLHDTAQEPAPITLPSCKPSEPPIACTLEPSAMPDRVATWQSVLSSARTRRQTADGQLRIEFDPDVALTELAEVVASEQRCCSFFSFVLAFDVRGIALEIDAPEGAQEIVETMFGRAS
jgi:DNA-binding transcriptional MerR regulator